jgi:hypothetical protein
MFEPPCGFSFAIVALARQPPQSFVNPYGATGTAACLDIKVSFFPQPYCHASEIVISYTKIIRYSLNRLEFPRLTGCKSDGRRLRLLENMAKNPLDTKAYFFPQSHTTTMFAPTFVY